MVASAGKDYKGHQETLAGVGMDMFIILMVMASQYIHVSKCIKPYTLKMCGLLYVNYTLSCLKKKA